MSRSKISYITQEYLEFKKKNPELKDISIKTDFEALDKVRDNLMKDWFIGPESGPDNSPFGGIRMQCKFDNKGNYANFHIYKSMGQGYHVCAAEFVSPTKEGLEDTTKGFKLPFVPEKVGIIEQAWG